MALDHDNPVFSAYLDGEATPTERTEVEQASRESEKSQRLLNDFTRLSRALHELPRHELPPEFSHQLLAAIERERVSPGSNGPASHKSLARRVIPFAASACCLLLMVGLLISNNTKPPSAKTSRKRGSENTDKDLVAKNTNRTAPAAAHKAFKLTDRTRLVDDEAKRASIIQDREPLVPPISPGGFKQTDKSGKLAFVDDLRKLTRDDIGRVITAMESTPAGISVVKLTVIDCREETLNDFQVLLARSRIHRDPGKATTSAGKQPAGKKRAPEMVAVYVQSSPQQLARAMAELKLDPRFQKLAVESPLAVAQLDRDTRTQLDPLLATPGKAQAKSRNRDSGSKSFAHSRRRRSVPKIASLKKSAQSAGVKNEDGKQAGGGREIGSRVAELDRISRQLRLTMSPRLLTRVVRGERAPAGAILAADAKKKSIAAFNGTTAGPRSKDRPVRVLFVLVCRQH